jgi:filamentous hemagglutinin family protein
MIMKKVRQITKKYYVRQIIACWMVLSMLVVMPMRTAMAEVVMTTPPGDITVTPLGAGTTQDMTAADGAIGVFSDFDIAATHVVTCVQPDAGSEAMFKINGNGTEIFGTFEANGSIWLIDPAGILVGDTGVIDVGGALVTSSLNLSDNDFLSGNHNFTAGAGAGDVVNEGTINAGYGAMLIGKTVTNTGLVSADNLVIMAAGNSVLITDNGTDIVVKVDMPEVDISDYTVDHGGDFGEGGIDAKRVALAAGDIWSSAYIGAHDVASSDAVATVIVDAEGDVSITGDISAHTHVSTGDSEDDAISTIDIDAGGSVDVDADVRAYAEVYNASGNATATVDITADENVNINGGDHLDFAVEAYAKAKEGSKDATATVDLHAGGNVNVNDAVRAYARTKYPGSGDSLATVDLTATKGNVNVKDDVMAMATTKEGSGNATATTNIVAGADITIESDIVSEAVSEDGSGNATATIDIIAGGNVTSVNGALTVHGGGEIKADADVHCHCHNCC